MTRSDCTIPTEAASKYLQQLCKHFAHKIPAEATAEHGSIAFPFGTARLTAADGVLTITVETDDAGRIGELEDVVARHLVRFAFRETLAFDWRRSGEAPAA